MTRNQLPEGVGKKIVEALKRQAEADISPMEEVATPNNNALPLTEIEDLPEIQPIEDIPSSNDDLIIEEEAPIITHGIFQPKEEPINYEQPVQKVVSEPVVNKPQFTNIALDEEKIKQAVMKQASKSNVNIPANVATLRNLINTLPVGVTKQTGAQIIRQTLEAMGIPMNSVLKEAQMFQEELNSSTRECMVKIQEYKTQILQLESSVQDYQQNITQVNDIVSLFLLTDK